MKKFTIILIILIIVSIKTNAQIPNSGFENWTTVGSYEDPTGWATTNFYSTGSFYAITKSTDHYPTGVGSYSVRIENNISLLPSYAAYGVIMPNTFAHPVFPITGHPNSLTGYYKCTPQNGDTVGIGLILYKNGTIVANVGFPTTTTTPSWSPFTIPITAYAEADSATIIIASFYDSGPTSIPHGNSVLYIDNLNFDNLIGSVSEQALKTILINLYPNPAADIVTLNIDNVNNTDLTLNIYNVVGTLVKSEMLKQNNRQINIEDLSNGVYMITIKSKDLTERQRLIIQR